MRRPLLVVAGLLVALLLAELAARVVRLPLRTQIVRESRHLHLETVHGEVVWRDTRQPDVAHLDCAAPILRVYGDSILAGAGLEAPQVFSDALRDLGCVQNLARPGFSAFSQLALAEATLPAAPGAAVVWELWEGGIDRYARIGDAAYRLRPGMEPPPVARALIPWSRLVEAAWLLTVAPTQPPRDAWLHDALPRLRALLAGHRTLLVVAPALHEPLGATPETPFAAAVRAGLPGVDVLDLGSRFAGTPLDEIRLDDCCHWNAAGHARIAAEVRAWLTAPPRTEPR